MAGITYTIDFAAAIARLEQGAKDGSRHVKRMADDMESAASLARNAILSIAGALGVGSFAHAVKQASEAADAAAKMGDRFGIATQSVIGLNHAVALAGGTQEGLAQAMRKMAANGIEAARGGEEAARAYRTLGLNAQDFIKLPLDKQLEILVDRLGKVENASLRNATGQQIMGRSYGEMAGLVAEGSEAIAQAKKDTEDWGLAINRVDAAKLEMANDAIRRAQDAAKGLFTTIAINVAPVVKALADSWSDTAAEAKGFKTEVRDASEMIVRGVAYGINIVRGLEFAWAGVKFAIAQVVDWVVRAAATISEHFADSALVRFMQYMPGPVGVAATALRAFGTAAKESVREAATWTSQNVERIGQELDALAERGLVDPEEILAKFRALRAAMDEEAKVIAARRQAMLNGAGGEDVRNEKSEESWLQGLAQRVARIQTENATELEILDGHLAEKQNVLDMAAARGLISDDVWQAQTAILTSKHEKDKTRIIDEETKRRFGINKVYRELDLESAQFALGQMAQLMQSKSKSMFEVGKAAAIGETIIQTYRAAQGAYAALSSIPIVGPALGIAAAAAAIISGMARVQAIRSQQFGSGGGAAAVYDASPNTGLPNISPPTPEVLAPPPPSAPSAPAQQAPQKLELNLSFSFSGSGRYTQEEIRDAIIPAINEAVADGVEVNINTVSVPA